MTQIASHLVTLRLPAEMIRQIELTARAQAKAPADVIRQALMATLSQGAASVTERLRKQASLIQCFDLADGWLDLQAQLRGLGYVLRHDGEERVSLHEFPSNDYLCSLHDIGQNQGELTRRYQSPFPGLVPEKAAEPAKAEPEKAGPENAEPETAAAQPLAEDASTAETDVQPVFQSLRRKQPLKVEKPKLVAVSDAPPTEELEAVFASAMFRSRRQPASSEGEHIPASIAS